jgi:hypothetical protein
MADDLAETESDNIRFLAGQVHALVGFCVAAINSHSSPEVLGLHLDAVEHVTLAHVESTLVVEEFIDGMRDVFDRLKAAVADAEARQDEPGAADQETGDAAQEAAAPGHGAERA